MRNRKVFDGQRGLVLAIFITSMFVNILILTAPLYMLQLFSKVMTSGSLTTLAALTIGAAIALFFYFTFDWLRQRLASRLGARLEVAHGPTVMSGLVDDRELFDAVGNQPVRDLQELRGFVTSPYFTALLDAPWSIMFVAVIFMFHPLLGFVALAGILTLLALAIMNELTSRNVNKQGSATAQKANRTADEVFRNADVARSMGKTPALIKRWRAEALNAVDYANTANNRISFSTSIAKFVRMGLQIAIMGTGVILVLRNELSPGLMLAASILLGRAAAPVEQAISGWSAFLQVRQSVQRLNFLFARRAATKDLMELPAPEGYLAVEDATVIVPEHQQPLVFGVDFQLKPGMSLGLIGPSGAGKTTLARAIVGLQPLTRGFIRIDDSALTDWPVEQIGQYIGFLPQRVELFAGTIAENIATMDPDAAPSLIVEAAKTAQVHDLILSMPKGYNTDVGQMGERLSAGQRQRIGLARAFYGDRKLIVLDEPNANLDPDGEQALARAIGTATSRGAVVVIVTHRHNILRQLTHAGMMQGGRLVKFGPSKDVLNAATTPIAEAAKADGSNVTMFRRHSGAQTQAKVVGESS
ncbi:ATP-binding cassette, subfamily C [Cognatiyoonia koreensis]|uniref:ATP-binding cassette, subfamily C n=1 Tax=Cognatiyoonia koreensis TaxID=364200 RepID=A0A1I0RLH9_9RHOB|nr:type I secretion system permease/ATPase [Cognatiyoonia koreensis]SEW41999.1 ATP-binding cassette, subfamily C [Cognatiyoonia koreensis]